MRFKPPTIQELESRGFSVRFEHERYWVAPDLGERHIGTMFRAKQEGYEGWCVLSPRGGQTTAQIYKKSTDNPQGLPLTLIGQGVAYCHPNDRYNKRIGRTKAFGRALSDVLKKDNAEVLAIGQTAAI